MIMKIKDSHILYINLKEDTEKRKRIEHQLDSLKLNYTRVEAVRGAKLKNLAYRKKISKLLGVPVNKLSCNFWTDRKNFKTMCRYPDEIMKKVGAYLSHMLAIQIAIDKNLDNVIIVEDDADFLSNSGNSVNIPKDADIVYLGGSFFNEVTNTIKLRKKIIAVDNDIIKLVGAFALLIPSKEKINDVNHVLRAVFLPGKGKDKHKDWRTGTIRLRAQALDFVYLNFFQKFGKTYLVNPVMINHKELGSNICNNRKKYKIRHFLFESQAKKVKSLF